MAKARRTATAREKEDGAKAKEKEPGDRMLAAGVWWIFNPSQSRDFFLRILV